MLMGSLPKGARESSRVVDNALITIARLLHHPELRSKTRIASLPRSPHSLNRSVSNMRRQRFP